MAQTARLRVGGGGQGAGEMLRVTRCDMLRVIKWDMLIVNTCDMLRVTTCTYTQIQTHIHGGGQGAGEMFRVTTLPTDVNALKKTKTGEMDFSDDFFGKPAFLTVSGQLSGEVKPDPDGIPPRVALLVLHWWCCIPSLAYREVPPLILVCFLSLSPAVQCGECV